MINTTLTELSIRLKKRISLFPDDLLPSQRGAYDAYLNCLNQVTELLEQERKQIRDSYEKGLTVNCFNYNDKIAKKRSEKYFLETYNTNQ